MLTISLILNCCFILTLIAIDVSDRASKPHHQKIEIFPSLVKCCGDTATYIFINNQWFNYCMKCGKTTPVYGLLDIDIKVINFLHDSPYFPDDNGAWNRIKHILEAIQVNNKKPTTCNNTSCDWYGRPCQLSDFSR